MSRYETKFRIDGIHRNSMHYVLRDYVDEMWEKNGVAQGKVAYSLGITPLHLQRLLDGTKPISNAIADRLGYRPVEILKKIK